MSPIGADTIYSEKFLRPLFPAGLHDPETVVGLKGPNTYLPGQLIGELTAARGTYAAYNPGATDGSQIPSMILEYGGVVDANNLITWPGDFQKVGRLATSAFMRGIFNLTDILGLDAAALVIMQGVVEEGTIGINEKDTVALSGATNTWDLQLTGADAVLHTFLALSGAVTAAALQAQLQAALGAGSVNVTLAGTTYTLWFSGAYGDQPVTVHSIPHVITSTDTQVTAGVAPAVASGTKGIVKF